MACGATSCKFEFPVVASSLCTRHEKPLVEPLQFHIALVEPVHSNFTLHQVGGKLNHYFLPGPFQAGCHVDVGQHAATHMLRQVETSAKCFVS